MKKEKKRNRQACVGAAWDGVRLGRLCQIPWEGFRRRRRVRCMIYVCARVHVCVCVCVCDKEGGGQGAVSEIRTVYCILYCW